MKKIFETPDILVENIHVEDVITASCTEYTQCGSQTDIDWD